MKSKHDFDQEIKEVKNVEDVTILLQKGMPIDYQDQNGNTLLMHVIHDMICVRDPQFAIVFPGEEPPTLNTNYTSIVAKLISLGAKSRR